MKTPKRVPPVNLSVDGLHLLEKVSAERVLHVDPSKVPSYENPKKREKHLQFLRENAPDGTLRVEYWLDGKTGGVRSRPNLQILSYDVITASGGHALVDMQAMVELVVALQDSGASGTRLANWVLSERRSVWDLLVKEFGDEDGLTEGSPEWKALRQTIKMAVWLAMYGGKHLAGEKGVEAMLQRVVAKYPDLYLKGTKEEKQAALRGRRLRGAGVWLEVALEAERQGCRVVGFWCDEPVVECPVGGTTISVVQKQLEDKAYGLLQRVQFTN